MSTDRRWVRFTVGKTPDLFEVPDIGLLMPVDITFAAGMWHARVVDGEMEWLGQADSMDAAILDLLAVRLGVQP